MQFSVRYWSSLLPKEYLAADGSHILVDYSTHPASKLGLHSALLSLHDRIEVLESHGVPYECAVYLVEGESAEKLTDVMAADMFKLLPSGDVKWIDIRQCLLPARRKDDLPVENTQQLPLFEHIHTPYDDSLEAKPHRFDADA